MRQLPKVVINGRAYTCDLRLREFRALDDPHARISFEAVDTRPEDYAFGGTPHRPFAVAYIRKPDGTPMVALSPACDGRPLFKNLPVLVRALARLDYLLFPEADAPKLNAAASPIMREAVMNDILYKRALRVALDPDNPAHARFIVDVGSDVDDVAGTGRAPALLHDVAELLPGRQGIAVGQSIIYTRRPDRSLAITVQRARLKPAFDSFPLLLRVQARAQLFLHGSWEENEKLAAAEWLPPRDRLAVWDDVLCTRAARIHAQHRKDDYALERACDAMHGPGHGVRDHTFEER